MNYISNSTWSSYGDLIADAYKCYAYKAPLSRKYLFHLFCGFCCYLCRSSSNCAFEASGMFFLIHGI